MILSDEGKLILIREDVTYDELRQAHKELTEREVYARFQSVGQREFETSHNNNGQDAPRPEAVAIIFRYDYDGEDICKVSAEGKQYTLYRTWIDGDKIYLYLRRRVNNV